MTFLDRQNQILRLKRTLNPQTGEPFTLAEIADRIGLRSKNAVFYYVKELKNVCPGCLRKLSK